MENLLNFHLLYYIYHGTTMAVKRERLKNLNFDFGLKRCHRSVCCHDCSFIIFCTLQRVQPLY